MKTQNDVQLIGYLGSDPVVKKAANGSPFSRIRLATDDYRRMADGKVIHKATWHDVLAWDKLAEIVPENFIKGSHILVKGSIRNRFFIDKEGHKRFISEIRATQLLNLDR
jgi:single-strand DNA-binding protein